MTVAVSVETKQPPNSSWNIQTMRQAPADLNLIEFPGEISFGGKPKK